MVTTIKVEDQTKAQLARMKEKGDSFDAVLNRLMDRVERKHLEKELIEGYSSRSPEQWKEFKDWDSIP